MRPVSWVNFAGPSSGPRLRLFCFPYAGGGTSVYRSWRGQLPDRVELGLIQLPGRETRLAEPAFRRMPDLLGPLLQGLRPHLDVPYAFVGHSMGTLIAFEAARRIRALGLPGPRRLFMMGHRAPSEPYPREPLHGLPDARLAAELTRLGGTPREILENAELMELLLPMMRCDLELDETYEYLPQPPLGSGISVYGGLQDDDVPRNVLETWKQETSGPFLLRMFPGNHFFIHTATREVLEALSAELRPLLAAPA